MLDLLGIPNVSGRANIQVFLANASTDAATVFVPWVKPRGVSMVFIRAIGAGGGGGGGFTRVAAAAGGGGGSGGGGATNNLTIPAAMLPDTLYIKVGVGGAGVGSGGGTAGSGGTTYVNTYPAIAQQTRLLLADFGTGGGTGTGAAVGALGSGGLALGTNGKTFIGAGIFTEVAGQDGVAGGAVAGAAGGARPIPTTGAMCMAGTSGGGTTSGDFAGGAITGTGFLAEQMPPAATTTSVVGPSGFIIQKPLFFVPGLGGASKNSAAGGNGGNGSYGCGGGGGGAGTTGGTGGRGGDGIVIVIAW